ncbi:MAG: molybdenum cofactor biosynthesis protein MoaE [Nitrospirae bacterium]|nr:molybdenum cofactor biosynthesis protein MoaE [Nitrospirota bacterium]
MAEQTPALRSLLASRRLLVSVNQEFAGEGTLVCDGDEVALLPPFSGGADDDFVRIQAEVFSVETEVARVRNASSKIGGVVTFLGTARDVSRGKAIRALTFEHYPGMAEKKLREIRERALRDFGVLEVAIIHRTGPIAVGEHIVLIVVGAEHREEAFRACQWCIDELKRIAPIWKRETTAEGDVWVEEHP